MRKLGSRVSESFSDVDERSADTARPDPADFRDEPVADALLGESQEAHRQLSTLGRSLVFKGELTAAEDLLIQGKVEGSIKHSGSNLTIGAQGSVKADIEGQRVIVQGTVHGDIRASAAIVIEPSAKVKGNMYAPSVALREGATFKGSIDMDSGPAAARSMPEAGKAEGGKNARSNAGPDAGKKQGGEEFNDKRVDDLLK